MNDRINLAPALREAAELLEAHPELPQPYIVSSSRGTVQLNWYLHIDHRNDLAAQKDTAATIVRTLGGSWAKAEAGDAFDFDQARGLMKLHVSVDRPAVCERVVVGTEQVTIPAVEAQPEQTVEREVVEWRCESLLRPDEAVAR